MNKKEILEDIQKLSFIDGLNGKPTATPDSPKADGGMWYIQNVREVNPDGKSAVYRNLYFYVIDEGKSTERAYYKDKVPEEITKKTMVFTDKIKKYAEENELVSIEKIEEDRKFAIIKKYIETEMEVTEKRLIVMEKADGSIVEKEVK